MFEKYGTYTNEKKEVRRFKCNKKGTPIKVYEYIHPERINFSWFMKRNLRYGLSGVYIDKKIYGYFNGIIFSIIKFFLYLILILIYLPLSIIKNIFFYKSAMYFSRATGKIFGIFGLKNNQYV